MDSVEKQTGTGSGDNGSGGAVTGIVTAALVCAGVAFYLHRRWSRGGMRKAAGSSDISTHVSTTVVDVDVAAASALSGSMVHLDLGGDGDRLSSRGEGAPEPPTEDGV